VCDTTSSRRIRCSSVMTRVPLVHPTANCNKTLDCWRKPPGEHHLSQNPVFSQSDSGLFQAAMTNRDAPHMSSCTRELQQHARFPWHCLRQATALSGTAWRRRSRSPRSLGYRLPHLLVILSSSTLWVGQPDRNDRQGLVPTPLFKNSTLEEQHTDC
jgi:hypothetical protein